MNDPIWAWPFNVCTPAEAKAHLRQMWHAAPEKGVWYLIQIQEMNWFLDYCPEDLERWTVELENGEFHFWPPDGTPGLTFEKSTLDRLVNVFYLRFLSYPSLDTPMDRMEECIRTDLKPKLRQFVQSPPWNEAADYGGDFFFLIVPEILIDETRREDLENVATVLAQKGVSFLQLAEWITRRMTDARICHDFLAATERGIATWCRQTKSGYRIGLIEQLLNDPTHLSGLTRRHLGADLARMKALSKFGGPVRVGFESRRAVLEEQHSRGKFFGKAVRRGLHQTWPVVAQVLFDIVEHLCGANFLQTEATKLAGEFLHLIAPDPYENPSPDLARKRYANAKGRLRRMLVPPLQKPRQRTISESRAVLNCDAE